MRLGGCGPADDLVVVGGYPHHPKIGVALDERAHALTHDQVVVREEYVDGAF